MVKMMERFFTPGQVLNVGVRKRFIDEETRAALAGGARQVLVVGGGFDTLSLRLAAEFPEVRFLEVDHPATQKTKLKGIHAIGLPANLELLPVDLAKTPLEEALAAGGSWRAGEPSVVIAEAVLMYLRQADVVDFLGAAHRLSGPGSRLLFTYMSVDARGRVLTGKNSAFGRLALRLAGEALLWGARDAGALASFLKARGWRLGPAERHDLWRRFLEPAGLVDETTGNVELVASADRV